MDVVALAGRETLPTFVAEERIVSGVMLRV